MDFLPHGPVALRSDLLVTLDCLDIGVSVVCSQGRDGQRQPTKNKPNTPSFGNLEMSAWTVRQEDSPDSVFCFSICSMSLSAIFAWICCLLTVYYGSSSPSTILCGLSSTLTASKLIYSWTCFYTFSLRLFGWFSHACCCIISYVQEKACQHQEPFLLW